jgi:ATP synthase subunit 6
MLYIFSPLEQFEIIPLFTMFFGSKFAFTNSSYFLCFILFFLSIFFYIGCLHSTIIPNNWQSIIEIAFEFIQNVIYDSLGAKGLKFIPLIFSVFTFILGCNILGLVPYTFTVTSHIVFTFSLGMVIFVGINILGFKQHRLHFFSLFLPPGAPLILAPLLVPIEIISYVFRVIALSVRLFANMMAGHTLLKILALFAWKMLSLGSFFLIIQFFPFVIIVAITGLELAIAFLQAYVWITLTCLYLSDALNLH